MNTEIGLYVKLQDELVTSHWLLEMYLLQKFRNRSILYIFKMLLLTSVTEIVDKHIIIYIAKSRMYEII